MQPQILNILDIMKDLVSVAAGELLLHQLIAELLPQRADMHIDRAGFAFIIMS